MPNFDDYPVYSSFAWDDKFHADDISQVADEDRVRYAGFQILAAGLLGAGGAETATLAAAKTILDTDGSVFFLDPGGASRDVNLPAEASTNKIIVVVNTADAAENLVVKDDTPATIITVGEGQIGVLWGNGTIWRGAVLNLDHLDNAVFDEGGATTTPASGQVRLYAKADGLLYSKDDAGVETQVSGGAGSGGADLSEIYAMNA